MSDSNVSGPPARPNGGTRYPRGVPWWVLVLAAVGLATGAIACWILAPGWVSPPIASDAPLAQLIADEASRRSAISSTRAAVVTGFLGLGALIGLAINNTSARAALASAEAARTNTEIAAESARTNAEVAATNSRVAVETLRITERGHLTDRYAKAVEQLGAEDNATVRLGGIYSLQQYAQDSDRPSDQHTVVEVLSAFLRAKLAGAGGSDGTHDPVGADVLAAVSVLAQLPVRDRVVRAYVPGALFHSVDISDARLAGGNLSGVRMDSVFVRCADLTGINLDGAAFDDARLIRCNLTDASLRGTVLREAKLPYAVLRGADLESADLGTSQCTEAIFTDAKMRDVDLGNANLEWTDLSGADLSGAHCLMANFHGASLDGVDLAGAQLDDGQLTAKQIASARNAPARLQPKPEAVDP